MKIDAKDKKEKTMEMGDVKALREVLVHAHQFLHQGRGATVEKWLALVEEINAALSMPVRNCDVGTLTEQQQRFHDYCEKMQHTDKACCGGCPIVHLRMQGVIGNSCELAWVQMPFKEEK